MNLNELPHGNAALALFPSRDGFGWILLDGPLSLVVWEVCTLAKENRGAEEKNRRCLEKAQMLLKRHRPGVLVLEAFEGPKTRRRKRIIDFCRSLIAASAVEGIPVRILTRAQINACFKSQQAKTRHEIAQVVGKFLVEIEARTPEKRKPWQGEFANMALLNAGALGIAFYANPREPL